QRWLLSLRLQLLFAVPANSAAASGSRFRSGSCRLSHRTECAGAVAVINSPRDGPMSAETGPCGYQLRSSSRTRVSKCPSAAPSLRQEESASLEPDEGSQDTRHG